MSLFSPIPIVSKEAAFAPIAEQLAAFEGRKRTLLDTLQKGHKIGPNSKPFDADKSWDEITRLAHLYFWGRIAEQNAPSTRDHIKRLHQLAKALRQAHGLTQRAIRDGVGEELYRGWFGHKNISPISAAKADSTVPFGEDGSSPLTRVADDIKEMVEGLATLATVSGAAATAVDVLSKTGRPALLPWFCIQGLARVYRNSTRATPGRGAGPFADFAYEFVTAVGQTGKYESLTDAIQDAHRLSKPSWFDENT
jgi:hypothetical protein